MSVVPSISWTVVILGHIAMYSSNAPSPRSGPMFVAHVPLDTASWTDLDDHICSGILSYRVGASSAIHSSPSQRSSQNSVSRPSPRCALVAAINRAIDSFGTMITNSYHDLKWYDLFSHVRNTKATCPPRCANYFPLRSCHLIGIVSLLFKFALKPEATPYISRIVKQALSSIFPGLMKILTSSAKIESLWFNPLAARGERIPI